MTIVSKRGVLLACMVAILCLVLAGCGQKQQASSDKSADNSGSTGSVIELKFHHHEAPTSLVHRNAVEAWAKLVEERTNGKVKITVYPAETLGKAKDAYDMVVNGITDIAMGFVGFFPGRFPMTEVVTLPMLGIPSAEVGSQIVWDLYTKTPYLQKEYPGVKVLFLLTHGTVPVCTTSKPVRSLEDLKGQKIRTPAGPPTEFAKQVGAIPVNVTSSELFEALQKGAVEGYMIDWHGIVGFRYAEVSNYHTDAKVYVAPFFVIMNEQKWNSLPPDVQKALEEVSGAFGAKFFGKVFDEAEKAAKEDIVNKKKEIIELSPEEQQRWAELSRKIWDKWLSDMEAAGQPGKAVFEETRKLIQEVSK